MNKYLFSILIFLLMALPCFGASVLFPYQGGTGLSSYSAGDILIATSTNTLYALPKGSDGQVLKLSGGIPAWGTGGTGGLFTDAGTFTYLTSLTDDLVIGSNATSTAEFYFDESTGDLTITGGLTAGTTSTFSGYVGIGTATPAQMLHMVGDGTTDTGWARFGLSATEYTEIGHRGSNSAINAVGDGNLDFRHDGTTRASLTDAGLFTATSYAGTWAGNPLTNAYIASSTEFLVDTDTHLTQAQVEDYAGGLWTGNTETLITITYQGGDNTLDAVVNNDLSQYSNTTSSFITSSALSGYMQDTDIDTFAELQSWAVGYTDNDTTANESITLSGDITGSGTTAITATIGANKILESHLKAVDAPADEECLTYESTTGDFEWQACGGGGGDITDVFDCSTGDCNTMTVGTSEYLVYGTGYIDANRFAGVTTVDGTEFGYLNGVSSGIQGQLDAKVADGCSNCLNATEIEDIYLLNTGDTGTGQYTFTVTDGGSITVPLKLLNSSSTVGTAISLPFMALDSTSTETTYGGILAEVDVNTDGSEDGTMRFSVLEDGNYTEYLALNGNTGKIIAAKTIEAPSFMIDGDTLITNFAGTGLSMIGNSLTADLGTAIDATEITAASSSVWAGKITDETGTGLIMFNNSPTLITPTLGTPTSGTLTSCTGLPAASVVAGSLVAGILAADHGAAATDQIVNVSYGTGNPPTASDTTEGSIFIKYIP